MRTDQKTDNGFMLVQALVLLFLVVLAGAGSWYVLCARLSMHTISPISKTKPMVSGLSQAAGGSANANPKPSVDPSVHDFYSCWQKLSTLSATNSRICIYGGHTYTAPTEFDKNQIVNLDKVPQEAQTLVVAAAKQAFNACLTAPYPSGQPVVDMAQANFVEEGVTCDSGHEERFGLTNGTWHDLGGSQTILSCSMVDTYRITRSAMLEPPPNGDSYICENADGTARAIS